MTAPSDSAKPPVGKPDYDQSVAGEEDPGASLEPAPLRHRDDATGTPGTGEALCRKCGGSGRDDSGAACTECQGTGKATAGTGGA